MEQLLSPFMEVSFQRNMVPAEESPPDSGSGAQGAVAASTAWSAWAIYQAGVLLLLVSGLGLLVLTRSSVWVLQPAPLPVSLDRRVRRRVLCAAAPYAVLAAVLLAWQAEFGAFLGSLSGLSTGQSDAARRREVELYKGAHDVFVRAYKRHQCKGENITNGHPRHLTCSAPSYEAKVMQDAVLQICRVRIKSPKQLSRLKRCFALGEQLGLDSGGPYSESYGFFCRCWAASLGYLPALTGMAQILWLGLFLGVLAAFYVAAEPGLSKMEGTARGEVLAFAVGAAAFLVLKAIILRPLVFDL